MGGAARSLRLVEGAAGVSGLAALEAWKSRIARLTCIIAAAGTHVTLAKGRDRDGVKLSWRRRPGMHESGHSVPGCDRRSFGGLAAAAMTFRASAMDGQAHWHQRALPPPRQDAGMAFEQALWQRRSIRKFAPEPLALSDIGQLLFAAQGITDPRGLRTLPLAGALYPLELTLVAGPVPGLAAGAYSYDPCRHEFVLSASGDRRGDLATATIPYGASPGNAWFLRRVGFLGWKAQRATTSGDRLLRLL